MGSPEAGEFSRIFVLKITLQSVRLPLNVSYGKNGGAGCTSCSPNNFVGGAVAPPVPLPMAKGLSKKLWRIFVLMRCD